MNESIESVDNLPKPPLQSRVNKTARSKEEDEQEPFDVLLKKKSKKKRKNSTGKDRSDLVLITGDTEEEESPGGCAEPETNEVDDKERPDNTRHIDLEA